MAAGTSWAVLPSVLILEILSYLSLKDRLQATRVCKRWRSCLFQPVLWPRLAFDLRRTKRERTKFMSDVCGRFLREVVLKFNSHNQTEVLECFRILDILTENKSLQKFSIQPSSCHFEWPDQKFTCERFARAIAEVIKNSRKLTHFSLGCGEELLEHSSDFLDLLSRHHSSSLEAVHLASVKEDSEDYGIIEFDTRQFRRFSGLRHLSIDYDFLNNELLHIFADGTRAKLETLCIHIHGVEPDHEKITNQTWRRIRSYCTKLEVTINLVHSYVGVGSLLHILQPNLPLAHFRQFFCSQLNTTAITFMATHFGDTLKSVHIIDSYEEEVYPNLYTYNSDEDPFVMLAWKCPLLEQFTLIGYCVADRDMIAIARLRGKHLRQFNIPLVCINPVDEEDIMIEGGEIGADFAKTVSESLERQWHPMLSDVPCAVYSDGADAEVAYMHILLDDQRVK